MLAHNEVFSGTALGHCDLWLSLGVLAFSRISLGMDPQLWLSCVDPWVISQVTYGIKYKECVRAVRVMVWVGKGPLSKEGVRARNGRMIANVRPV